MNGFYENIDFDNELDSSRISRSPIIRLILGSHLVFCFVSKAVSKSRLSFE